MSGAADLAGGMDLAFGTLAAPAAGAVITAGEAASRPSATATADRMPSLIPFLNPY